MKTSDFDFDLPPELIAQTPAERRDAARLFVYRRDTDAVEHRVVSDLPSLLSPRDLMVFNDTKVRPARLFGRRPTGGKVELLLLNQAGEDTFEAVGKPGRGLKVGGELLFDEGLAAVVEAKDEDGRLRVRFVGEDVPGALARVGHMPLPPYIRREAESVAEYDALDKERYQTVYARETGAVAAPTAGLHFTPELLASLDRVGVGRAFVTLHVGEGTFRPVRADDLSGHEMHSEGFVIDGAAADAINARKVSGGRILAVGTTSCRALESAARGGRVCPGAADTRLFIAPGYEFRIVDRLMTNFHLPKSTLLMLVSALVGRERLLELYAEAVRERYRFFSYGDAMLIL
ncbi:tRNA preQ1(34) S-adenosylmethionine ribosyltransferase-isomerase QueA [bacterium]|nr:tRNA preQ1(34) S-adenosylmethionine ribosyltransferase-isomerase QueA [bacterium]MCB9479753.1 tRNA preQ1(34) S-adenosylmethionine ribosyltransferase-isomerase QueA [Deltaproteobacteria bacterium]